MKKINKIKRKIKRLFGWKKTQPTNHKKVLKAVDNLESSPIPVDSMAFNVLSCCGDTAVLKQIYKENENTNTQK